MITFFNAFTKITGWPAQKILFRTKIHYEDEKVQKRRIKGPAIIISNHTSVYDYAVFLFVFFGRTLRYQMAEVLFEKKLLAWFLKCMGGIFIDRYGHDFHFMVKSENILNKGGIVGIFPEGRIPEDYESRPLEFQVGAAQLALMTGASIIPVYTNGSYFNKKRAEVIIGKPIYVGELADESKDYKTNLKLITENLRNKIIELEKLLEGTGDNEKEELSLV